MINQQRGIKISKKFNQYINQIDDMMDERDRQEELFNNIASLDFSNFRKGEKQVNFLLKLKLFFLTPS